MARSLTHQRRAFINPPSALRLTHFLLHSQIIQSHNECDTKHNLCIMTITQALFEFDLSALSQMTAGDEHKSHTTTDNEDEWCISLASLQSEKNDKKKIPGHLRGSRMARRGSNESTDSLQLPTGCPRSSRRRRMGQSRQQQQEETITEQ